MHGTSEIEIDLGAIAHNMRVLRGIVGPGCRICPVVKAEGYGLGADRVAHALTHPAAGGGAEMLAVYTLDQAAALFQAAITTPVLVMMPVRSVGRADDVYRALVCSRLHLAVHDEDQLGDLVRLTERFAVSIPVHLEVDTGMSRGGCDLEAAPALLATIGSTPRLQLAGLYTHFVSAATDAACTAEQNARFVQFLESVGPLPPSCLVHAANTCATIRDRAYHHDMVRVGQAWAGYGPEVLQDGQPLPGATALRPCVRWSSRILQIKRIPAGASVGYGGTWTAKRDSLIGLVPVGYADGYPLALSSGRRSRMVVTVELETPAGPVRADAPVVGRVNMDQVTIDLTVLKHGRTKLANVVQAGARVELISPDRGARNHLVEVANAAGTSPYEVLCRLHPRIPRRYRHVTPTVEVEVMPAGRTLVAAAG